MNTGVDDKIIPSLNDIVSFAIGCEYSLDQIFSKEGMYWIPYDNIFHNGIGIFRKENFNDPILIFDHDHQTIFILDPELVKLVSDKIGIKVYNLSISYVDAFKKDFNFNNELDAAINSSSIKISE